MQYLPCPRGKWFQGSSVQIDEYSNFNLEDDPMLKLKTTVAACLALSAIGGIIACSSQLAKSGGDTQTTSSSSAMEEALNHCTAN